MLRVETAIAGALAHDVVKQLVSDSEERAWTKPEHRVVKRRPFRRIASLVGKLAVRVWHGCGRARRRMLLVHVPRLMAGPDCVVELVGKCPNILLEVVEAPIRVVEGVCASVEAEFVVVRLVLNHNCAGGLVTGIPGFPYRHVVSVSQACLDYPVSVELECPKYSPLAVGVKAVEQRVARHEVV